MLMEICALAVGIMATAMSNAVALRRAFIPRIDVLFLQFLRF
jgi:hypothetical protein